MAAKEIEKFRELVELCGQQGIALDICKFNNGTYDVTGYGLVSLGVEIYCCESLEEVEAYINGFKQGVVSGKVA